ncbi:unnamed protein product [Dovyalis caffra]|uniref:Transketolase n=1 Tax=Dovyalis caffra TaxID=77055 RepID=A0AAV1RXU7_9ROSI|nr:unnamed protein product [Dovyalis caffra]
MEPSKDFKSSDELKKEIDQKIPKTTVIIEDRCLAMGGDGGIKGAEAQYMTREDVSLVGHREP